MNEPRRIGCLELIYDDPGVRIRHHGTNEPGVRIDGADLVDVALYLLLVKAGAFSVNTEERERVKP